MTTAIADIVPCRLDRPPWPSCKTPKIKSSGSAYPLRWLATLGLILVSRIAFAGAVVVLSLSVLFGLLGRDAAASIYLPWIVQFFVSSPFFTYWLDAFVFSSNTCDAMIGIFPRRPVRRSFARGTCSTWLCLFLCVFVCVCVCAWVYRPRCQLCNF